MKSLVMKNGMLVFLLSLSMVGCTSAPVRMDKEELGHLRGRSDIKAVHYPPFQFSVRTPGKAIAGGGGALGAMLSLGMFESAGDKMTKEYALADPAPMVQERFVSALGQDPGITTIQSVQETPGNDDLGELKRVTGQGLVFDFKTTQWMLFYYPTDWSHYRIAYSARGRLVRLEDSKVIWLGTCEAIGQDPTSSPTMDELTANNGALLKTKINEAAETCAQQLLTSFRGET